ncbi:helix-turn-helix transcriptional regulator [Erwinia sp. E_sp_B04_7]|uniref:helix-turn-helix domain-containing protein n=1 Tax=unclassified Erwinia TaxID=2622719 RepID=UPI0030D33AEF
MSVAARLQKLREQSSLSQPAMAASIGINVNTWINYVTGKIFPSGKALHALALKHHVSIDYLLFGFKESLPEGELMSLFRRVHELDKEEQKIVVEVLESIIFRYQMKKGKAPENSLIADNSETHEIINIEENGVGDGDGDNKELSLANRKINVHEENARVLAHAFDNDLIINARKVLSINIGTIEKE